MPLEYILSKDGTSYIHNLLFISNLYIENNAIYFMEGVRVSILYIYSTWSIHIILIHPRIYLDQLA